VSWKVEKSREIALGNRGYSVNVTNTGFNLLFEIYEHLFGRIFFSVDYWPDVKKTVEKAQANALKGRSTREEVIITSKGDKKLRITYRKGKHNFLLISRMMSDNKGLTWIVDKDKKDSRYRRIRVSIKKTCMRKIVRTIDEFFGMIEKGEIQKPRSEGFDLYYANEMAKHDRTMLSFKKYLDGDDFAFFLRLDENVAKSDRPYKIARAAVAREAKEAEMNFLPEKRGDDGFVTFTGIDIVVDWELRRDWAANYNNIPIRFAQRNTYYHAVAYPPPNPGESSESLSPSFVSLPKLIAFMKKKKLRYKNPYFIYRTLGQFERKMKKPQITLSIQCNQASPRWPKTKIPSKGAFFVAAWHQDFTEAGTVTRTTQSGAGELGGYWECDNFGIFQFNRYGVELFKKILKKQYSKGVLKDRNGNVIPRNRRWI
jgi:hypothetical protein